MASTNLHRVSATFESLTPTVKQAASSNASAPTMPTATPRISIYDLIDVEQIVNWAQEQCDKHDSCSELPTLVPGSTNPENSHGRIGEFRAHFSREGVEIEIKEPNPGPEHKLSIELKIQDPRTVVYSLVQQAESRRLSGPEWKLIQENPLYLEIVLDLILPHLSWAPQKLLKSYPKRTAELLMQDVRIAVFDLLKSYDPGKARLSTYLNSNVVNRVIDQIRGELGGRGLNQRLSKINEEKDRNFKASGTRDFDPAKIGLSHDQVKKTERGVSARAPQFMSILSGSKEDSTFGFEVADNPKDIEQDTSSAERREFRRILTPLSNKRALIHELRAFYNIELGEIAHFFDLSDSRISQIFSLNQQLLKTTFRNRSLDEIDRVILEGLSEVNYEERIPFDVCRKVFRKLPEYFSDWTSLEYFNPDTEFVAQLLTSADGSAQDIRALLLGTNEPTTFDKLEETAKQQIAGYVASDFPTLDSISLDRNLLALFDNGASLSSIYEVARLGCEMGLFSARRPIHHPIRRGNLRSMYFIPTIVGTGNARENGVQALSERIDNLDQIESKIIDDAPIFLGTGALMTSDRIDPLTFTKAFMGNSPSGFLSATIPDNHQLPLYRESKYFLREYVDDKVDANITKYLNDTYGTLDDFPVQHMNLAKVLGSRNTKQLMAKAAVAHGYMSGDLPPGNAVSSADGHLSLYFERDVVGEKKLHSNIKSYLNEEGISNLDQITKDLPGWQGLCGAMKCPKRIEDLVRKLTKTKPPILSPQIPDGHELTHGTGGGISYHLRADLVGKKVANENIRKAVLERVVSIDEIDISPKVGKSIGIGSTDKEIAAFSARLLPSLTDRPEGSTLARGQGSRSKGIRYLYEPEIVGHEKARENFRLWVKENWSCLHEVEVSRLFARIINLTRIEGETEAKVPGQKADYAAILVERGWLSPQAPVGYQKPRGARQSIYDSPQVIAANKSQYP